MVSDPISMSRPIKALNLLPEELKAITKRKRTGFSIEVKYFLYLIPFILGILICAHIYLTILIIAKNSQLYILNKKWQSLEPQRKTLENFNKEYAIFSQDALAIKELTEQRINWSQKLNKLSLDLPSGIWFNEISVLGKDFILQGSVVSLQKEEMSLIKKLIDNLKNDPDFFKNFGTLELSSAQKKTIGSYEVVDFILTGTLKPK